MGRLASLYDANERDLSSQENSMARRPFHWIVWQKEGPTNRKQPRGVNVTQLPGNLAK